MKLAMDELAQTLFEEAGDGLFFFEPQDGHLIDVNPMGQRLTGYPRHELLRLSVKGLFSAEAAGGMARLFRAFQSTGLFHSQEGFLMRGAQGRTIPVNLTVTRVHARQGTLGLITARDITERRQAEEALRRSERHYRNLFENAHDAILLLDPINERVLDANRRACELYGFARQEFIGLPLDRICPDEAGTGAAAPDADLTKTPSQTVCHRFETVHRRKDGSEILLEVNSSVIRFGSKQAVLTINRDVTLWGMLPHTHVRGKRWTYEVVFPDGRTQTILSVPKYDFEWQTDYLFRQPLKLPQGARLHATAWYDNSPNNKSNPDSTKDIWWGDQTWEEMMFTGLTYSVDPAPAAQSVAGQ